MAERAGDWVYELLLIIHYYLIKYNIKYNTGRKIPRTCIAKQLSY